jgi:xanthine dehydrogenase FAD-binding subunit
MSLWKQYHIATTIDDALEALAISPQPVCLVAGGTDLLLELQQGHHPPVHTLVDLTRIPELNRLEVRDDRLFIGASVPVNCISESPFVLANAQAVAEGCALIGGPQVRNAATLGGNVAHALPAADGMIGLVAMDAVAVVADRTSCREVPILSLFIGPGQSSLISGKELLVGFYITVHRPNQASAFRRIMRPQGLALPILNTAVWLERDGNLIKQVRIAIGPAGPTPQRAMALENFLNETVFNRANLDGAKELLRTTMRFRTSPYRSTADYRYEVGEVLIEEVLTAAWVRSGGELEMA